MNNDQSPAAKYTVRQFCKIIPCSRNHAYDLINEGYLRTQSAGPREPHTILAADWEDFFDRLEADRRALNKPWLRFPRTKAGEQPTAVSPAVEIAARQADDEK